MRNGIMDSGSPYPYFSDRRMCPSKAASCTQGGKYFDGRSGFHRYANLYPRTNLYLHGYASSEHDPTVAQATIPPFLASIPGIAGTLTAVYSTPGAQETLVANQTRVSATEAVSLNQLSGTLLSQCPNPSDPPLKTWVDVPVMPQATAGQEVQTLIGSYYCFRAPVTVQDMENFYKQNLPSPAWVLQSDANGSMVFIGLGPAGAQFCLWDPVQATRTTLS